MGNIKTSLSGTLPVVVNQREISVTTSSRFPSTSLRVLMVVYLGVVIIAEIIAIIVGLLPAAVIDGLLLIGLANYAYFAARSDVRHFIPSLALVPLLRILSIAIPIPQAAPVLWYAMVGFPLLVSAIIIIRYNGLPVLKTNLNPEKLLLQIVFGISGILLGILANSLLPPPQAVIPHQTWYWYLLGVIILTVFSGFTEEIIFRGFIQDAFAYSFGLAGVFISAGLYTALFFGTLQPLTIVFFGLTGLIFAIWVRYSHSLLGVIIAHSLLNIIFLLVNHVH